MGASGRCPGNCMVPLEPWGVLTLDTPTVHCPCSYFEGDVGVDASLLGPGLPTWLTCPVPVSWEPLVHPVETAAHAITPECVGPGAAASEHWWTQCMPAGTLPAHGQQGPTD